MIRRGAPSRSDRGNGAAALIAFFSLAYLLAWAVWIPAGLLAPATTGFVLLGAWAPTVAALAVVGWTEGRAGLRRLLGRLLRWRAPVAVWATAILGVIATGLLAVTIHVLLGGALPDVGVIAARFGLPADRPGLFLLATPLIYLTTVFVGGPIAEELGWRGFAHPRLAARVGAGPAGLIVGLLWSLWHLPLFALAPSAVGDLSLTLYVPLVTALGVLFAWVAERGGGSVPLAVALHASVNSTLGVVGAETLNGRPLAIFAALTGALALLAFVRLRRTDRVLDLAANR